MGTRELAEAMAAAAVVVGLDREWALELARNVALVLECAEPGDPTPEETAALMLKARRAAPNAGLPARYHGRLPPPELDAAIARAMALAWERGAR